MGFAVRLESAASSAERRTAPRTHIRLTASIERADEPLVIVHDISRAGMLLETSADLSADEQLKVEIAQGFVAIARVVWRSGNLHGCAFEKALPQAAVSAARLRSPVDPSDLGHPGTASGAAAGGRTARHCKFLTPARLTAIIIAAALSWVLALLLVLLVM